MELDLQNIEKSTNSLIFVDNSSMLLVKKEKSEFKCSFKFINNSGLDRKSYLENFELNHLDAKFIYGSLKDLVKKRNLATIGTPTGIWICSRDSNPKISIVLFEIKISTELEQHVLESMLKIIMGCLEGKSHLRTRTRLLERYFLNIALWRGVD